MEEDSEQRRQWDGVGAADVGDVAECFVEEVEEGGVCVVADLLFDEGGRGLGHRDAFSTAPAVLLSAAEESDAGEERDAGECG